MYQYYSEWFYIACKKVKNVVEYTSILKYTYIRRTIMQHKTIDGELFKQLVINGAANLSVNYKEVDALNVFPVPDGDTGTNMRMTIEAGANEIKQLDSKSISLLLKSSIVSAE